MLSDDQVVRIINKHLPLEWLDDEIKFYGKGNRSAGLRAVASRLVAGKYKHLEQELEKVRQEAPMGFFSFRDQFKDKP